jgi:hypothetical protein
MLHRQVRQGRTIPHYPVHVSLVSERDEVLRIPIRRINKKEESKQRIRRLYLGASLQVKSMVHAWLDAPRASRAQHRRVLLSKVGEAW